MQMTMEDSKKLTGLQSENDDPNQVCAPCKTDFAQPNPVFPVGHPSYV